MLTFPYLPQIWPRLFLHVLKFHVPELWPTDSANKRLSARRSHVRNEKHEKHENTRKVCAEHFSVSSDTLQLPNGWNSSVVFRLRRVTPYPVERIKSTTRGFAVKAAFQRQKHFITQTSPRSISAVSRRAGYLSSRQVLSLPSPLGLFRHVERECLLSFLTVPYTINTPNQQT